MPDATYAWDFGPGASPRSATGRAATARLTTAEGQDSVRVRLTATRDACVATAETDVRRRTRPVEQISATPTTTDPTSCGGANGSIAFAAADPSDSCIEFRIDGTDWTRDRRFDNLSAGTYTLRVQYCNTECSEVYGTFTLTDPAPPVAAFTSTGLDECFGTDETFTATAVPGATYVWDFGTGANPRTATASAVGNRGHGVNFAGATSRNAIGTDGDGTGDARERNVISGNGGGLRFISAGSGEANVVAGNYIGLGADGLRAVPNRVNGVNLEGTHAATRIGTDADGRSDDLEANYISGNGEDGIRVSNADGWTIAGNYVGLAADGTTARGNGKRGIFLDGVVEDGTIGYRPGVAAPDAAPNVIAHNDDTGIGFSSTGKRTRVSRNRTYDNGTLAIDLGYDLVTPNDGTDLDEGPNGLLDFPVFSRVELQGSTLRLEGFAPEGATVEVFVADAGPSPSPLPGGYTSAFGEGRRYVADFTEGGPRDNDATEGTYRDDGTGATALKRARRFSVRLTLTDAGAASLVDARLTATATTTAEGTSEFGGHTRARIVEICDNGIDDDGDGATDCDDAHCPPAAVVRRAEQR